MLTFEKPIEPNELIENCGVETTVKDACDHSLIRSYQYSTFVAALAIYPSYRWYSWSTHQENALSQLGSPERLTAISRELQGRGLLAIAEKTFAISFISIALWIANMDKMVADSTKSTKNSTEGVTP